MRRLRSCGLVALLVAIALLGNTGCNNKDDDDKDKADASPQTDALTDAAAALGVVVVFQSDRDTAGKNDIYVRNIDAETDTRLTTESAEDRQPTFSPTAERIAFTSNRSGNDDIYIMDREGKNVQHPVSSGAADEAPAWSPDGKTIVFVSNRDLSVLNNIIQVQNLFAYDLEKDSTTALTKDTTPTVFHRDPVFSPDGSKIAFISNRDIKPLTNEDIYVMQANGSEITRLTQVGILEVPAGRYYRWPTFSPDGQKIAYVTNQDADHGEIWIMNADGTGVQRLTTDSDDKAEPYFTKDGKIVFSKQVSGKYQLYLLDPADKSQKPLNSNNNANDRRPRTAYGKRQPDVS